MSSKVKRAKFIQVHITAPVSDVEKWQAFKKTKYNGAPAFSMMCREFINAGIDRELAKGAK